MFTSIRLTCDDVPIRKSIDSVSNMRRVRIGHHGSGVRTREEAEDRIAQVDDSDLEVVGLQRRKKGRPTSHRGQSIGRRDKECGHYIYNYVTLGRSRWLRLRMRCCEHFRWKGTLETDVLRGLANATKIWYTRGGVPSSTAKH